MGKGARAHFQFDNSTPLSSADVAKASKVELGPHSLYNAESPEPKISHDELIEEAPMFILLTTYMSYLLLIVVGHVRDFIDGMLYPEKFKHLKAQNVWSPLWCLSWWYLVLTKISHRASPQ